MMALIFLSAGKIERVGNVRFLPWGRGGRGFGLPSWRRNPSLPLHILLHPSRGEGFIIN